MPVVQPVGARLAREGVLEYAKSFAGKPRSYRSGGVSDKFAAQVKFDQSPNFSGFKACTEQSMQLAERRLAGHAATGQQTGITQAATRLVHV